MSKTHLISFSATPFLRVAEAKVFCVSTHKPIIYGAGEVPLTGFEWPTLAQSLAGTQCKPEDYNEAAIERLMKEFDDYIVSVKGVRPQFKAINKTMMVDFRNALERQFYDDAYERFLKAKAKAESENDGSGSSNFTILVELLQYRKAAELIRAEAIADDMFETVQTGKQVAVSSWNFKGSIAKCVEVLVKKHGVARDDISLIWGGGKSGPSKRQKKKAKIMGNDAIRETLEEVGITMEDLNLDTVQDYIEETLDPALELGIQSKSQRQENIDKFQSGKSHYCLFTLKAGGVGLSLHHTDELCNDWDRSVEGFDIWYGKICEYNLRCDPKNKVLQGKIRRKPNNFAVEEDIPYVYTKQRVLFGAPTYSAIELVQMLGRCPRLTSLSETPQSIVFYRGTIEESVNAIVSFKLRCLKKVVRSNEAWESLIIGSKKVADYTDTKQLEGNESEDEDDDIMGGNGDSDED